MDQRIKKLILGKINDYRSDLEIVDALKKLGINEEKSTALVEIVKSEINAGNVQDRSTNGDHEEEGRQNTGTKELATKESDLPKHLKPRKVDKKFLDEIEADLNDQKSQHVHHKNASAGVLILNSLYVFFTNIHKYLFLLAAYAIIPLLSYYILSKTYNETAVAISYFVLAGAAYLFLLGLSHFIGNEHKGYIDSIAFSVVNFIPIFFTLLMIEIAISAIVTMSDLPYLIPINMHEKAALALKGVILIAAIIASVWYSLAYFVMVNEDEFYINAISKSRKYVKHHFTVYVLRFSAGLLAILIMGAILLLLLALFMSSKDLFNWDLFMKNPNFVTIFYQDLGPLVIAIMAAIGFIMLVWPLVFFQHLYQDFAAQAQYVSPTMSKKHQNLFFVALMLGIIFYQGSSYDPTDVSYQSTSSNASTNANEPQDEAERFFEEEKRRQQMDCEEYFNNLANGVYDGSEWENYKKVQNRLCEDSSPQE